MCFSFILIGTNSNNIIEIKVSMNTKYLSLLTFLATLLIATPSSYGETVSSTKITVSCQTKNSTFTTLAKTDKGAELPIFHWKEQALPAGTNLQQICDRVSDKLEKYLVSTDNLLSVSFKSIDLENIPTICLAKNRDNCSLVLLTLDPHKKPMETANKVLESILDPKLQANKAISNERGIQSTYYPVGFWELFDVDLGELWGDKKD